MIEMYIQDFNNCFIEMVRNGPKQFIKQVTTTDLMQWMNIYVSI